MRICRLNHRTWFPRVTVSSTLSIGRDAIDLPNKLRERMHLFVMPSPGPDLFAQGTPFIKEVFGIMNHEPRHEYHIATRHIERAVELANELDWAPNIWLGAVIDHGATEEHVEALRSIPAKVRFAHVQSNGTLPTIDVAGLNFVIVEARREPAGLSQLEDACKQADARLFFGPRAEDAELRTDRNGSTALAMPRRTR